jgi:NAD(P)-dependent dehydrogenase (short-subunit alcohol dehydrogenase family)
VFRIQYVASGPVSPKWTAANLRDLSGQTVVVTGASNGLGVVDARELARVGARVILAVRDVAKGQVVADSISGTTEVRELNLADLESVRAFAASWSGDLDILINNAGIMLAPAFRTPDDFELHIGTNHFGPFALTNLLLPHITKRIVTVSSILHRQGRMRFDDINFDRRPYVAMQAYRDSKLANLLFTFELQRRLTASGVDIRAVAAHPGIARTNLVAHARGVTGAMSRFSQLLLNDDVRGALPTLFAATEDVAGGEYVGPDGLGHLRGYPVIQKTSKRAQDATAARELWELSARLTNTDFFRGDS